MKIKIKNKANNSMNCTSNFTSQLNYKERRGRRKKREITIRKLYIKYFINKYVKVETRLKMTGKCV